jgi:signal transduction histidine kinase
MDKGAHSKSVSVLGERPGASAPVPRARRRRASIGLYLGAVIVLQALLFTGLTILAGVGDYNDETATAAASSDRTAELAADRIVKSIDTVGAQMASEAAQVGYDAVFAAPTECVLTSGGTDAFADSDIHLMRLDGSVACSSAARGGGGIKGKGYSGSDWLERVTAAKPATAVVAGPLIDPLSGKQALIVAAKMIDTDGALVTALYFDSLAAGLGDRLGQGRPMTAFTVTASDRRTILGDTDPDAAERLRGTGFADATDPQHVIFDDLNGVERIYGQAEVKEFGWHVWAGVSSDEALADARESMRETFLLGIGALLVVLVVGAFIRRRITRPVRSLAAAVDEAAEGNLSSRVPTDGPRELANLGERFNIMLDIRARSEEALVAAYEKERCAADSLRELDAMKNGFLMAISHELRTPLTSVVGYASLLEDPEVPLTEQEKQDSIHRIASQARRLERLLTDLLDIERMSRGTIEAHRREVDLRELVMRVVEQISGATRVSVKVPARMRVSVDAGLMERVTENLIVNAIKHTPPNTNVYVRASRTTEGVVLMVEDSGPGVPDHIKADIFEPFRQGDVPDHAPGTGIGLALVKQFAKLHGGKAWVEDRAGGGASFRVLLPAEAPKKSARPKTTRRRTRNAPRQLERVAS